MNADQTALDLETDPRFPSGPWTGFFVQKLIAPGKHTMELRLQFRDGTMTGEGRDWVGPFLVRGRYDVADGQCHFTKSYLGRHDVFYRGFNEGKGIWGTWGLLTALEPALRHGGFHIWPEGMPDPTQQTLVEEADLPVQVEELELVGAPADNRLRSALTCR